MHTASLYGRLYHGKAEASVVKDVHEQLAFAASSQARPNPALQLTASRETGGILEASASARGN
jgi:hypothetical protein